VGGGWGVSYGTKTKNANDPNSGNKKKLKKKKERQKKREEGNHTPKRAGPDYNNPTSPKSAVKTVSIICEIVG